MPDNNTKLVSVIIPMFNAQDFIGKAIESVQSQMYKNWEMLVVDDCSTDRSREIVRDYSKSDERIKLLLSGNNFGGPARPRNIGFKQAKGEYIAFLDADDFWLEQKLQRQVDFLGKHPDIFMVYSQFFVRKNKEDQKIVLQPSRFKSGKVFKDLFLSVNFIACSTVMFRNNRGGSAYFFDEDKRLIAIEDFDLWLKISHNELLGVINEPLAGYAMHNKGISRGAIKRLRRNLLLTKKWNSIAGNKLSIHRNLKLYLRYCLGLF